MAPGTKRKSNYKTDDFVASDDSDTARPSKRSNKASNSSFQPASNVQVDSDGNRYWEISKARRVTISEFKGKSLVNIREYYEKDGNSLPGKKGISMTIEQYSALINLLPQIETLLQEKGESVPRPNYSGRTEAPADDESGEEMEDAKKSNIEATSDEDE